MAKGKVKSSSSSKGAKGLDWLKKTNDFLEGVPMTVPKFFDAAFKSGEATTQTAVDLVCAWIAWKVNIMVERARQRVVRTLYDQYGAVLSILAPITKFKNAASSPLGAIGAVASAVKGVLDVFIGPFKIVINFIKELGNELLRLAENLAKIAEVTPPDPPNPQINYNAFKDNLSISTITLSEVISGPEGMPSPEEKFPEPPKPFVSKEYWKAVAEGGSTAFKNDKVFYYYDKNNNNINAGLVREDKYKSE